MLDKAQAGIKIAGRKINNCKYTDDTALIAESEEELKSLLTTQARLPVQSGKSDITFLASASLSVKQG